MTTTKIGRFRIEDGARLGDAGSGCPAFDERLRRRVLLRPIRIADGLTAGERTALEDKVRAAAALNHPAIAQVHDVVTIDDRDYLVLEHVDGNPLSDLMAGGRLTPASALRIGAQVAEGLAAAHAAGIVHGDLTAEAVVVTAEGQAKILDLGLAGSDDSEATPADTTTDLIALAALLRELLTGRRPDEATPATGAAPTELPPRVSPQILQLTSHLLEAAASGRPTSAAEIAAALREQVDALTLSMAVAKVSRRRRYTIAACVAVIAVASAWWFLSRSEPEPLYVAVRRPTIAVDHPTEVLEQAAAGVRVAAINTLAGLVNTYALESRDVDEVSGGATEVARAMAADEVLEAAVTGEGIIGRVSLSRLSGVDGAELWSSAFDVPLDNMMLVVDTVTAHVRRGFSDRPERDGTFATSATPEGYAAFLQVYRQYWNPSAERLSWEQLLRELEAIRRSSPQLLDAYGLEMGIAAYLYRARREEAFLEHAQRVCDEALELAPEEPAVLAGAISVAFTARDLDRADTLLAELQRVAPLHPTLPWCRARVAEARDRRGEAIEIMLAAVRRYPSWRNNHALGRLELRDGRIPAARQHLGQVLSSAPNAVSVLSRLAELELVHGPPERAEELYLRLIALAPTPDLQTNLGVAQLLLGRYPEAARRFKQVLERRSRHPTDLLNLADAYHLMGDVDRARPLYREAVERFEGFGANITPEQLGIMAQAQVGAGEPVAAVVTVQEAFRRAPRSPDVNFYAALVYATVGDRASALTHVQSATDLGVNPHWFRLPWFDGLRSDARFVEVTQIVQEPDRHTAAHASP